ncbi:MAG: cobaltochelatase CobT-related protein [Planctomycetota bacterium]
MGKKSKLRFETTLEKIARICSNKYGLSVQFEAGTIPHTDGVTIVLPVVPPDLPGDLRQALEGWCDHEVGHCLFSDPPGDVYADEPACPRTLINALEDARIERLLAERFPGTAPNIGRAVAYTLREAEKVEHPPPLSQLTTGLYMELADHDDANGVVVRDRRVAEALDVIREDAQAVFDCSDTLQVRDLAERLWAKLREAEEPPPPPPPTAAPDGEGSGGDVPEGDEDGATGTGDGTGADGDEGTEGTVEDGDETDGGAGGDDTTGPDGAEGTGSEGEGTRGGASGAGASSADSQGEPDNTSADGAGGADADGENVEGDEGGNASSAGKPAAAEAAARQGNTGGIGGKEGGDVEGETSADAADDFWQADADAGDPFGQLAECIQREVSDVEQNTYGGADLSDTLVPTPLTHVSLREEMLAYEKQNNSPGICRRAGIKLLHKTRREASALRRRLIRRLRSKERVHYEQDLDRGRLNPRAVHRLANGTDSRVFRRKRKTEGKVGSVALLLDMSSSMRGEGIRLARKLVFAFGDALDKAGVPFWCGGYAAPEGPSKEVRGYPQATYTPTLYEIKRFSEPWRKAIGPARYTHPDGLTPTAGAVREAAKVLAAQPTERKVMFVLTDGLPVDVFGKAAVTEQIGTRDPHDSLSFRYTVASVEQARAAGIEVIGLCCEVADPAVFGEGAVVIRNWDDLLKTGLAELCNLL